jgi:hypothetical protein
MDSVTDASSQAEIADSLLGPDTGETTEISQDDSSEQGTYEPGEEQQEEVDSNWLPDEQSKIFPDAVYQKYADSRYKDIGRQLRDPNTPEPTRQALRQILHDKINSDAYIQQLRQQSGQPSEEEFEEETAPSPVQQPPMTREQYFGALQEQIAQRTDPQVATQFFTEFMKSLGVAPEEIQKLAPQQAMPFTKTMSVYALNLMNTFMKELVWDNLKSGVEDNFPGFGTLYERQAAQTQWDTVRNSNEAFSKLPAYGTKEFATKAREAVRSQFGSDEDFENMQFTRTVNGRQVPLTPAQNVQYKYRIMARLMAGGEVNPRMVQQSIQTGVKQARQGQVRRSTQDLSAGRRQSRGAVLPEQGADDPSFWQDGLAIYRQRKGRL